MANGNHSVRLMLDFTDLTQMYDWVSKAKEAKVVEADRAIWEGEALDYAARKGGVGKKYTYALRPETATRTGKKLKFVTKAVLDLE